MCQKNANQILRILECNDNLAVTKKNLNLTDQQLAKFKIDSKTLFLRLSHFYEKLEEGENAVAKYQAVRRRGLGSASAERNLKACLEEIKRSVGAVRDAKDEAWNVATEISAYLGRQN